MPDYKEGSKSFHDSAQTQHRPTMAEAQHPTASDQPLNGASNVEQVQMKAEGTGTPPLKNGTPSLIRPSAASLHDPTAGTPLKNVVSTDSPDLTADSADLPIVPAKPKAAPVRKRPAPKKGTATKPPAKKRKVDTESGKSSSRTGTPATSRASGTPVPRKGKQESATPTRSSSVANFDEDDEDDDDDGELELFCICRKPDDHTVMIGCDGPCEDWFHTRCVNMTDEKVALISKWYCTFFQKLYNET